MTARIKKNEAELKSQKTLIEELEAKVKESYEAQMQVTHNSRKDIAMRDQQIEFLTMQLKETKEQLEESQRQHQSMVEALNKNNEGSDDEGQSQARLELLQKEFDATSQTHLNQIAELNQQNEQLSQKLGDTEHENRLAVAELQHKLSEAKITHDDLIHGKTSLSEKIKQLEAARERQIEEHENQMTKVKQMLEKEANEKDEQAIRDQAELQEQKEQ